MPSFEGGQNCIFEIGQEDRSKHSLRHLTFWKREIQASIFRIKMGTFQPPFLSTLLCLYHGKPYDIPSPED